MSGTAAFASSLNLSTGLTATTGFRISGTSGSQAWINGAAGDVNGDGFDDLLAAAPYMSQGGGFGAAMLVAGRAGGWSDIAFGSTPAPPAVADLTGQNERFGVDVAGVGDVNGDGLADFVVGESFAGIGGVFRSGAAYLVFGTAAGLGDTSLSGLTAATGGIAIYGANQNSFGVQVEGLGDVNGDGFADIGVVAASGVTRIVLGKAGGANNANWSNINLAAANAATAPLVNSASIAPAGDLNGDGYADFAWATPSATVGANATAGVVTVAFGGANLGNVDFSGGVPQGQGFRILGATANRYVGNGLANAGDVNGDGLTDLLVGSNGAAFLLFGRAGGWTDIDLGSLTPSQGISISGTVAQSYTEGFGAYAAGAGDVNGDGFDDVLVANPQSNQLLLFLGRASGWTNINFNTTPSAAASVFTGGNSANSLGIAGSFGAAGDVNGDGFGDLRMGAYAGIAGATFTLFSQATGTIRGTGTTLADSIHGGAGNDSLFGYGQNDTLQGQGGDDTVEGGAGNDSLDGGAGNDTLSYAGAAAGVTVSLAVGNAQNTGGAGTDIATNFENLLGSAFNDTLTGHDGANTIEGGGGNDLLAGGQGIDTVSYAGAGAGVTVSLDMAQAQNTGGAGTDTLTAFENLFGSLFHDTLLGGIGDNTLFGDAGNDTLFGGLGDDSLNGGKGLDTATFAQSRASFTLTKRITEGWTISGPPGTDTLSSIERLAFSDQTITIGPARTEDMAGRGFGDVLFQSIAGGWLYRWEMSGAGRGAEAALGGPGNSWAVAGKGDFNGDAKADLLWRNGATGQFYVWLMDGTSRIGEGSAGTLAAGQSVAGVGDTDGDGRADILLRGADGSWAVQRMDGTGTLGTSGGTLDTAWSIAAVADFNGDLRADVLWRNGTTGQLYLWQMNGTTVSSQGSYATPGADFAVAGTGDFDGDGRADVLIKHGTGNWFWGYITSAATTSAGSGGWMGAEGGGYTLAKVADYTGDDQADLLFFEATNGYLWLQGMNGLSIAAAGGAGVAGSGFSIL
ncbi:MAG: FG-GAP-like repeat-containing protein [Acetobacteraceae bacterium]|nr:FG-GAP-like repeat-containing protein [Acetobacteraceae bacterium]